MIGLVGGLLTLAILPLSLSEDLIVSTKYGAVRGRRVNVGQSDYIDTFLGIPFAEPPVGPLRFKEPQPARAWNGIRNATQLSPICPQEPIGLPDSEDCLYLNVYSSKPPNGSKPLLPVMVWIHGGAYRFGSGGWYNGSSLVRRGVVVVTINYRLDILGFLSTQDASCPGNFGLLDQILALKWVKNTISSFQGDPDDVTIFGESAGATSVSLLRLSPLAQGLFSKAIMQSGVSLCPWAVALPTDAVSPLQWAQKAARRLGCAADNQEPNSATMVTCLSNVPVADLVRVGTELFNSENIEIFRPTVETVFGVIPDTPLQLLLGGAGRDIKAIRGVNQDEYGLYLFNTSLSNFTLAAVEAKALSLARSYFPDQAQAVADKLIEEYITSQHFTTHEQHRAAYLQIIGPSNLIRLLESVTSNQLLHLFDLGVQMMSDFHFIVPAILEQDHSVRSANHAAQFLYEFTYRATHSTEPEWAGVTHSSELPFVFGQPFIHDQFFAGFWQVNWTSQDMVVSLEVMGLWTNFAKHGNPTPQPFLGITWPPYTIDSKTYLAIGTHLALNTSLNARHVQFWSSLNSHSPLVPVG